MMDRELATSQYIDIKRVRINSFVCEIIIEGNLCATSNNRFYLYLMIAFFLRCSSSLQSLKRTPSPPVRTRMASTRAVAARVRGSVRAATSECGGWVWCRPRPGTSSWGACLQRGQIEFCKLDFDVRCYSRLQ